MTLLFMNDASCLLCGFLTGFTAGCLLVKQAEEYILRKAYIRKTFFHPITEKEKMYAVLLFAAAAAVFFCFGKTDWLLLRNWLFISLLFLVGFVDHFIRLIPNEIILHALLLWGLWSIAKGKHLQQILLELAVAVIFAAGVYLVNVFMEKWKRQQMLGMGDIKLLFVCVLYLGFEKTLYVLLLACICGLATLLSTYEKHRKPDSIAFGPCIAFSAVWIMLL